MADGQKDSKKRPNGPSTVAARGQRRATTRASGPVTEKESLAKPELVFAFVRSLGTNVDAIERRLVRSIRAANYGENAVRLSNLLSDLDQEEFLVPTPVHERYRTHMDLGDNFRSFTRRNDAVALLGVREIVELRGARESEETTERGWTYRIQSLMHPQEVKTLRQIYGPQIFIISAASPQETRLETLARAISRSTGLDIDECRPIAMDLLNRDAGDLPDEANAPLHPSVRRSADYPATSDALVDVASTFQMADVFVSPNNRADSERTIERLVDLIFDHPFHTPTIDEMGMYSAFGFALRSSALSRQVGAVIATPDGEIVAGGTNDVPKFGGGLYWAEVEPDHRDFRRGFDSNDVMRRELLMDVLNRLSASGWLTDELSSLTADELVRRALDAQGIAASRILDVIEYGRAVHAEMAALSEAARRGINVQGDTLYCTTFPCHECARHIVAAGIERVVYIEAYAKSRVAELYEDSIGLASQRADVGDRVVFEPFVGIGPRRFRDLFSRVPRKNRDTHDGDPEMLGEIVDWDIARAMPRETIMNRIEEYYQTQTSGIRQAQERAHDLAERLIADFRRARR